MIAAADRLAGFRGQIVRTVFIVPAGVALTTLAAKAQVPFWPVPTTLHTLAAMAFAVALGPRPAASIFLAYLAAGAVGFPGLPAPRSGRRPCLHGRSNRRIPRRLSGRILVVGALAAGRTALGRIGAMVVGLVVI